MVSVIFFLIVALNNAFLLVFEAQILPNHLNAWKVVTISLLLALLSLARNALSALPRYTAFIAPLLGAASIAVLIGSFHGIVSRKGVETSGGLHLFHHRHGFLRSSDPSSLGGSARSK